MRFSAQPVGDGEAVLVVTVAPAHRVPGAASATDPTPTIASAASAGTSSARKNRNPESPMGIDHASASAAAPVGGYRQRLLTTVEE